MQLGLMHALTADYRPLLLVKFPYVSLHVHPLVIARHTLGRHVSEASNTPETIQEVRMRRLLRGSCIKGKLLIRFSSTLLFIILIMIKP